jgi:transposase-like protein
MEPTMGDDRAALRDLVEHALGTDSPEAGLRAVAALRAAVDALEHAQARRALQQGASFADLARALGITRQSAHRRYRHLAGEAPPKTVPSRSRGRVLITAEARTVVDLARAEARALGAPAVASEHLLLGILRLRDSATCSVLRSLGATLRAARDCAQPTLVDGQPPAPAPSPPGRTGISPYARTVFEHSLREALSRGDGYIGTDHLLLAALRDPNGGAARTLEAMGVPAGAVRAQLERA